MKKDNWIPLTYIDEEPTRHLDYKDFQALLSKRNVSSNNPKLHKSLVSHFNPNKKHWLKKFMDLYLQEDERKRT